MPRLPRLPRDISGDELIRRLGVYGYEATRQTGSHVRLTRASAEKNHHVSIPRHRGLRLGTVNSILNDVAAHVGKSKDQVIAELFS